MKVSDTHQTDISNSREFRGSYVLRLWSARSGDIHGYLLDARSGVRHPLQELADLPTLVQSIIAQTSDEKVETE